MIPFRPQGVARPLDLTSDALEGTGYRSRVEQRLSLLHGGLMVRATVSATQALEVVALDLDIAPGDEVVVPAFTFPSSAAAFAARGARIRFADIDRRTLGLDVAALPALITARTRAIVAVHYGGYLCDIEAIVAMASANGIPVIEDAAHGLGAARNGRRAGTFGDYGVLSFHRTKAVSCGEGGAVLFNRPVLENRVAPFLAKGVNRAEFTAGAAAFYEWMSPGSSHAMSELHAAVLLDRLDVMEAGLEARRAICGRYDLALGEAARRRGHLTPAPAALAEGSCEVFYLGAPDVAAAEGLIRHLASSGIEATRHYRALNLSPMGLRVGDRTERPAAEWAADCLVRLPLYESLSPRQSDAVIEAVLSWLV